MLHSFWKKKVFSITHNLLLFCVGQRGKQRKRLGFCRLPTIFPRASACLEKSTVADEVIASGLSVERSDPFATRGAMNALPRCCPLSAGRRPTGAIAGVRPRNPSPSRVASFCAGHLSFFALAIHALDACFARVFEEFFLHALIAFLPF